MLNWKSTFEWKRLLLLSVTLLCFSCGNEDVEEHRGSGQPAGPTPVAADAGAVVARERPPAEPPLSPAESLARIQLPPGYEVECVLAEPEVQEPVMIAWDPQGCLLVVEMLTFMQDIEGSNQLTPMSRILRFEDADADGKYEKRTVFADKLVLPRALLPLDDRILIRETNSRDIVALRDVNGDGVAETREIFFKSEDVDRRNLEHQDANLLWNIDNWIYSCQGGLRLRVKKDGTIQTGRLITEMNQWGLTQDDSGQLFFADNATPARDFQQPFHYWNLLNNDLITADERQLMGPDLAQAFLETWPAISTDDAQGAPMELRADGTLKQFTCACGQHIYRGDALPGLRGNYFVCEPVGRLIRRATIRNFHGQKILDNPHHRSEFLRSRDYYFRPVYLDTGPDGHLYIVDMNRGIIQESAWVTQGSHLRRVIEKKGLARVKRRGRILRLKLKGQKVRTRRANLARASTAELVRHLSDPNGWWRDTAQRLLVLRNDGQAAPLLRKVLHRETDELGRLHALWSLSGLEALTPGDLKKSIKDLSSLVRAAAIRNLEPWLARGDMEAEKLLLSCSREDDPKVIQQLILTSASARDDLAFPFVDGLIRRNLHHSIVMMAAITAFHGKQVPVFADMRRADFFDQALSATPHAKRSATIRSSWMFLLDYRFAAQRRVNRFRHLSADEEKSVQRGFLKFRRNCVQCHGSDAKGVMHKGAPVGANLVHSDRILGNPAGAVQIILHGLKGEIDGREIGVMIPYASQDDTFIADILSSLRWPLRRGMVTPEFVAGQRALTKGRRAAWTLKELGLAAAPRLVPNEKWRITSNCGGELLPLVDGNLLTRFHSDRPQAAGMTIQVHWGESIEVGYVVLDSGDSRKGWAHSVQLEVLNADGNWERVGTIKNQHRQVQETALRPVPAQALRLVLTADAPRPWSLHQVYFYGLKR